MTSSDPARTPVSRRERPAKPALTRQGIIDAALTILREEGLGKVTMRRIATALDTGPASLYVYVRDTEDLHAQILDALLAPVTAASPGAGLWRDRLKALLTSYRDVLFAHPEIARMALSTQPSGPNYLALCDAIAGLLNEGGVPDRAAAWGLDLLLLYPTAIAVEQSSQKWATLKLDDLTALAARITTVDAERYPHLARLGDDLVSGEGPDRADWALDVLLDGMLTASSRSPGS
ncbi:TetR/AcrR family transcriptional regulator [Nonomuraea guangzhouensis]|uniref:TetR/AcrR family transcriptional regulator n=1 Tax=Nonomuraea guangzhouensis TaxID=1291555 RepID=A0ABW4GDV2_9ACTN|nr:TetR/AcrR family transcriptional regulator [Nonomuraea guangzhouensis]